MRGPGAVPGLYATESAMNELADQLKIDPVRLRILNEPKIDEWLGHSVLIAPFARVLRTRRGEVRLVQAHARGRLDEARWPDARLGNGRVLVDRRAISPPRRASNCATMARPASPAPRRTSAPAPTRSSRSSHPQKTGVPLDKVEVALGDTSLPAGPLSGGSMATGSVVPAVFAAADSAIASLLTIATITPGSPFEKRKPRRSGVRRRPGLCEG